MEDEIISEYIEPILVPLALQDIFYSVVVKQHVITAQLLKLLQKKLILCNFREVQHLERDIRLSLLLVMVDEPVYSQFYFL